MPLDTNATSGICLQIADICQEIRKMQGKKAFSGKLIAFGQYSAIPAGPDEDGTYLTINLFHCEDLSAHLQIKATRLIKQAEQLLEDLGQVIRQTPALDHDQLKIQIRLGQRSRRGPRVKLNILSSTSREDILPVLSDEIENLARKIERLDGIEKPAGRVFVIDERETIPSISPEAALRTYATFRKPALFKAEPMSYPSIHEIIDPVGPTRALLS